MKWWLAGTLLGQVPRIRNGVTTMRAAGLSGVLAVVWMCRPARAAPAARPARVLCADNATVPGVFFVGGEKAGTTLLYAHATAALGARLSPGERLVDASETAWNVKEKFFWGRDAGFGASSFAGGAAARRKYLRHYAPCPSSVPWACPPGDATWCVRAYGSAPRGGRAGDRAAARAGADFTANLLQDASAPRQIARAYGPHLSTRVPRG